MPPRGRREDATCREYVLPALAAAGWKPEQIVPQYPITKGRVVLRGNLATRDDELRADYVLELTPGFAVAVVEAKREYGHPADGMQQVKEYAELLDLPIALSTNGHGIVSFDFGSGTEREISRFPRPDESWELYRGWKGIVDDTVGEVLLEPFNRDLKNADMQPKEPYYYQRVAIHRIIAAILGGRRRLLLTMATGTGKTFTALQIVWKMWRYWQHTGDVGIRRILYLTDRDVLVGQPLQDFQQVFGDDAHRILGENTTSRNIYFATYQALDNGSANPRYMEFARDYFDLIIVDECHRGSAREESNWREILNYFAPAAQLGLTATPKQADNVDTYAYFGNPIYSYSLRQGINDGFLAPYRVRRVVLSPDAYGWRPDSGQLDRFRREIPDEFYTTVDFERTLSLLTRTETAAEYLTAYMRRTDTRMAKMVIFCVDSEHAADMRGAMTNANSDLGQQQPQYVARIVSREGDRGKAMLARFQDPETITPVVATTARMLSTGVDIPTLRTIVLFRPVRSIIEFKQIIGRGTRLAPDYDKNYFEIIDFTGATTHFEDPEFDGPADSETDDIIDGEGNVVNIPPLRERKPRPASDNDNEDDENPSPPPNARKFYVDDTEVFLTADMVYITDPDRDRLKLLEYNQYVASVVRRLYMTPTKLRRLWRSVSGRAEIAEELRRRGVDLGELSERTGLTDADPFDALVYLAWNEAVLTRYDRVRRVRRDHGEFFARYQPEAREILDLLLERYAEYGVGDLSDLRVLQLEPVSQIGTIQEIIKGRFGTPERLQAAVNELQARLYAA